MSPWWRERIRVYLAPDRLVAVRLGRGPRRRVLWRHDERLAPVGGDTDAMLDRLRDLLQQHEWRRADAQLLLSSRLVHHQLLPWTDVALDPAEQATRARHVHAGVLGDAASTLELRTCAGGFGQASLVSGVDQALLAALRAVFAQSTLRLVSVQPYLAAAFNEVRRDLPSAPCWLAVVESGTLCTALLDRGQWLSLRSRRIAGDWAGELHRALHRQGLAHAAAEQAGTVLVHAADEEQLAAAAQPGWTVRQWQDPAERARPGGLALAGVV